VTVVIHASYAMKPAEIVLEENHMNALPVLKIDRFEEVTFITLKEDALKNA
jgi:hypothetical protein